MPKLASGNGVFVVIPAYNEAGVIARVIHDIKRVGYKNIIIVDDGSDDETKSVAVKNGAIAVRHTFNRGKGAAIKTGIEAAKILRARAVITMDADGQHDPIDITKLEKYINRGFDIVLGTRQISLGKGMPYLRVIANSLGNFFTWMTYGLWVNDSQSGFRAYSAHAIESLDTLSEQYEFDSEVIRVIVNHKLSYVEVPIKTRYTTYSMTKVHRQSFINGIYTLVRILLS